MDFEKELRLGGIAVSSQILAGVHAMNAFSPGDGGRLHYNIHPRAPRRNGREPRRDRLTRGHTTTRVGNASKLTSSNTAKPSLYSISFCGQIKQKNIAALSLASS